MSNITIIRADKALLPQLIKIWQTCFGDEEGYIRYYYDCTFSWSEIYAALDGEKAIGMIHLLPAELDGAKAFYGYAMGMLPEYRGKGIFLKLQDYAFSLVKELNMAYFLKPANAKLASYYQTQGFDKGFYLKKAVFYAGHSCDIELTDIEPEEYKSLRDSFYEKPGYVRWGLPFLEYAIAENRNSGGIVKKIINDSGEYIVFGSVAGNSLLLRETSIPERLVKKLCSELAYRYNTERTEIELPVYSKLTEAEEYPVGMIYYTKPVSGAYFNLPLD